MLPPDEVAPDVSGAAVEIVEAGATEQGEPEPEEPALQLEEPGCMALKARLVPLWLPTKREYAWFNFGHAHTFTENFGGPLVLDAQDPQTTVVASLPWYERNPTMGYIEEELDAAPVLSGSIPGAHFAPEGEQVYSAGGVLRYGQPLKRFVLTGQEPWIDPIFNATAWPDESKPWYWGTAAVGEHKMRLSSGGVFAPNLLED